MKKTSNFLSGVTKNARGFTLIEVVLVLAIGGLIFLLAFLAFQQVSRNRRDTQRRNDVARMAAVYSDIKTDSPGVAISTACAAGSNWRDAIAATPNLTDPTSGSAYSCVTTFTATGQYTLSATQACIRLESGSSACRVVQ